MSAPPAATRGLGTRLRGALRDGGAIAVAIVTMNVATYAFQMVAARLLGPEQYGGVSALMALFLVAAVVQLGLQATAARRIAAAPGTVAQLEWVVLRVSYRAGAAVGGLLLVLSPVVSQVLRLDSITAALLLAVGAVPLTIMGGQAGILQGERRWLALALVYLALGIPRLLLGSAAILVRPTEGAAMAGVTLAMFAPVLVGWLALRGTRAPGERHDDNAARPTASEAVQGSVALLAFFVLSNVDIILARNVLEPREAGLYAGGLILTKAVLFLPQFVVVVAFPALSTPSERRRALQWSLAAGAGLGGLCVAGAVVLDELATFFIGGAGYSEVTSRLWVFAVVGTLLSLLQLLVYSALARRGRGSAYLTWVAVVALVGLGLLQDSLAGLLISVVAVDAVLLTILLALAQRQMAADRSAPTQSA